MARPNATEPHTPPVYLGASLTPGSQTPVDSTPASSASTYDTRAPPSQAAGLEDADPVKDAESSSAAPALGRSGTRLSFKPDTKERAADVKDELMRRQRSRRGDAAVAATATPGRLERVGSTASQCNRCASPNYPASALSLTQTRSQDPSAIYIDWPPNDPENPFNWPKGQRWLLAMTCFFFTTCTAFNATGYPIAAPAVVEALDTTTTLYLLGNTLHLIAVAVTPMILAPASEVYGRRPIFLVATFLFTVLFIPQALAPNIAAILISRWFQGMAGSVGNSMAAGLASDLFVAKDRGFVMSLYAVCVFLAQGASPALTTITLAHHSWRVAFWWYGAVALLGFACMVLFMKETRGPVLLSRRARRLTKETGKLHRCRADDERLSVAIMIRISLVRPFQYLLLEPTVLSFSLWIGFLWGLIFISLEAVPIVFAEYGWDATEQSLVLLTLTLGGALGYGFNFHQERLYARQTKKYGGKPPPEARLYYACAGAVVVPVGLFIFAWTGQPSVHPAAPIVGLTIFATALFPIYLAVFSYLGDVYERYASSALAAQSFLRNVLGGCFPLFSASMYRQLTPRIASTVLGALAVALGIVPFILFRYGDRIRQHSKAAMALQREEREAIEFFEKEEARLRAKEERRLRRERAQRQRDQEGVIGEEKVVEEEGEHEDEREEMEEARDDADRTEDDEKAAAAEGKDDEDLELGRTRSKPSQLGRRMSSCDCAGGMPSVSIS
ncbi:uncharacterized protein PFL1_02048 [Pseudozyma flocculosa PF-1]|uniref:Related to TPO1 - Vacuolar polyamine-H+ antiporter n=1 Tax=Pseudozyma flocculosa TaxID=84751 RepID=A0A5C3F2W7_9BASI|nr:uncharacterized protein PFL1_02048 [Pseudozyma flocculosa PF-1]EPQ30522.1 hypothetical protein PFL1_02048 [Pseudozyma flocculosa PF-1]SPO37611.1 related to TPO1 - Vacuolar polyamine-H+ antiporter [Pseudozyma flocculosa]